MGRPLTIFMSAAEASGDHHAARLMRAIRRQAGDVRFIGAAGPQMAAEGCEVVVDLTRKASMVGGPFMRLGYYYRNVRLLQRAIEDIKPDVLVPVDSPALNWHMCKTARKIGTPVMYYIAPQVWAWAPWRVKKLARLTDAVACILPFEQEYLRKRGVNATYVGHPLFDDLPADHAPPNLEEAWADGTWRVTMAPGSRMGEIRGHAPALCKVAKKLLSLWPNATCIFAVQNERAAGHIRQACESIDLHPYDPDKSGQVQLAVGKVREVMANSHFGLIKSGTVTLEAAWFGMPMAIFYRTGYLLGLLHRTIGKMPAIFPTRYLSLVNILAGKRLVDELMPWHGSVKQLQQAALNNMQDLGHMHDLRQDLLALVEPLHARHVAGTGDQLAADNAAKLVLGLCKTSKV